ETAWGQSKTQQDVHKKFPQEMAKRTVINRAAKAFINTSDDSDLLVDAINRSTENEYDNERKDITPEQEAQQQIEQNANTEVIDIVENKTSNTEPVIIDLPADEKSHQSQTRATVKQNEPVTEPSKDHEQNNLFNSEPSW